MATQAGVFVSSGGSPIPFGSGSIEQWRVAAGASTGDTVAITPKYGGGTALVYGVMGPCSHNLSTTPTTNVTCTLQGGTATLAAVDIWVYLWPHR